MSASQFGIWARTVGGERQRYRAGQTIFAEDQPGTSMTEPGVVIDRQQGRTDVRYVAVRVDSAKWKAFIVGGGLTCGIALLPSVEIFDQATVRSLVFAGGVSALLAGLLLRRRFRSHISSRVRRIIDQHR